jgi:hypothetical protein
MKTKEILLMLALFVSVRQPLLGQDTQGFFLEDFQPKTASIPQYKAFQPPAAAPTILVTVDCGDAIAKVSKYLYGNNSNIYMGQMVTEPKLIEHIRALSPNVVRYPGGNISNLFFWNAVPGQPFADTPEKVLFYSGQNPSYQFWCGFSADTFNLSVDNYYSMLQQTNSTGVVCVNYAYARYGTGPVPVQTAAHLAADWVRYDKGRTPFWEVGNENYGRWQSGYVIDTTLNKDGQAGQISGGLYGKHFKIFADSMRAAAKSVGVEIKIGAQVYEVGGESYDPVQTNWNSGFFKAAGNEADFFVLHSYFTPFHEDSRPAVILNSAKTVTRDMMDYMKRMSADLEVVLKPVALTEWNIFAIRSKQSCSFIGGMHAAMVLGELAKNKYGMACRWDLVNRYNDGDDHGMFNYGDEPGVPRWNPRPSFFTMYYFQKCFGDRLLGTSIAGNGDVAAYASRFGSGQAGIVVVNKGINEQTVKLDMKNFSFGERYYLYSLTGGKDNGEFSQSVYVNGRGPDSQTGGPINDLENIKAFSASPRNGIKFISPAYSIQYILVENNKK